MKWLTTQIVTAIHAELVAEHGGPPGIRDAGLLKSALARPRHRVSYGTPAVFELCAAYGYGISKNHPFIDGNKRTALMACYVFLRLNGYGLTASEPAAARAFLDLAAGKLAEPELALWLKANTVRILERPRRRKKG